MPNLAKCLGSLAVVGLLSATPAQGQTETLDVWATPSIFASMFEGLKDGFEAQNPGVTINLDASRRDQSDMVQAILRQAVVGDLPDVSFQGLNFLRTVAERDITQPLEDFIANDPAWTDKEFAPAVTASATFGGTVHGLGVGFAFPVLFYNADLVREVQGDAPFPSDWEAILELSAKIDALGDDTVGGFHRFHPWFFQSHVNGRGGMMMNSDESAIAFDGPEGLAALELVKRFGEVGQARRPMSRAQARQAFVGGTVGILTDSSSGIAQRAGQIGENFELGIARFPVPSDEGRIPAAGIAVTMLTDDPDRQKVAWDFMRFVVSPEGQEIVARETSYVPANELAVVQSEALAALYEDSALLKPVVETLPAATAWYAFPGANAAKIDSLILDTVERVSTLSSEPANALADLKSEVEQQLPR